VISDDVSDGVKVTQVAKQVDQSLDSAVKQLKGRGTHAQHVWCESSLESLRVSHLLAPALSVSPSQRRAMQVEVAQHCTISSY